MALVAIMDRNVRLPSAVLMGLVLGSVAAMLLILGVLSPFALELGRRDRGDVGNELGGWSVVLPWFLIVAAVGGAAVGAACGTAAWALRFVLGQMRSGRERDTA